MKKQSAGILVYRKTPEGVQVLLSHPGGPIWGKKDTWSIPKGELEEGEDYEAAARREFDEEMGLTLPDETLVDLGSVDQGSTKRNYIWALEADIAITGFRCRSTFEMEWPPKSGKVQIFPENDKAGWFSLEVAKTKLFKAQVAFIDRLAEYLGLESPKQSEQSSLF